MPLLNDANRLECESACEAVIVSPGMSPVHLGGSLMIGGPGGFGPGPLVTDKVPLCVSDGGHEGRRTVSDLWYVLIRSCV